MSVPGEQEEEERVEEHKIDKQNCHVRSGTQKLEELVGVDGSR